MSTTEQLTDEGLPSVDIPESSKREYLLAQIRQKDAIIESLLKQVRYRMSRAPPRRARIFPSPTVVFH